MFRLLRADDWGIRWVGDPAPHTMPVCEVSVHSAAGRHPDDPIDAFRALNDEAIRKGYKSIEYTVLVHRNRQTDQITVAEGRGKWRPAATKARNPVSKAICLLGSFQPPRIAAWSRASSETPTDDELKAIAWAIRWMVGKGWLAPDNVVRAHEEPSPRRPAWELGDDCFSGRLERIREYVGTAELVGSHAG